MVALKLEQLAISQFTGSVKANNLPPCFNDENHQVIVVVSNAMQYETILYRNLNNQMTRLLFAIGIYSHFSPMAVVVSPLVYLTTGMLFPLSPLPLFFQGMRDPSPSPEASSSSSCPFHFQ